MGGKEVAAGTPGASAKGSPVSLSISSCVQSAVSPVESRAAHARGEAAAKHRAAQQEDVRRKPPAPARRSPPYSASLPARPAPRPPRAALRPRRARTSPPPARPRHSATATTRVPASFASARRRTQQFITHFAHALRAVFAKYPDAVFSPSSLTLRLQRRHQRREARPACGSPAFFRRARCVRTTRVREPRWPMSSGEAPTSKASHTITSGARGAQNARHRGEAGAR